jgi:hypothetical protein
VDPNMLASQALALVSPYLARVGEAAAQTAGEAAAKQAEAILGAIRRRFGDDKDAYAEQTLDKVIEQPEEEWPKQALEGILASKARQDAAFKAELEQLLQNAKQAAATQQFSVHVSGGKVRDIHQIGSVGTINSGASDQPR